MNDVHVAMAGCGQQCSMSCQQDLVMGMDATLVGINTDGVEHASHTVQLKCTFDNGESLCLKSASIFGQNC